jgi:hypothetical protein
VEQPPGHGRLEELALVTLPRRHVDANNDPVAITNQMDLGAEAATRTPERMVRWLLQLRLLTPAQPARPDRLFFSPRRLPGWPG